MTFDVLYSACVQTLGVLGGGGGVVSGAPRYAWLRCLLIGPSALAL